jgi:hypothetical protein
VDAKTTQIALLEIFIYYRYNKPWSNEVKGPHRPGAIRQRDANFQFSKTNKTING